MENEHKFTAVEYIKFKCVMDLYTIFLSSDQQTLINIFLIQRSTDFN